MRKSANTTKKTFENEFEELMRWPYSIHAIDDTLDSKLIEGRGKQLLFQGLNQRNLVAFVGSGLSQAYGHLSWQDWLKRQLDIVEEGASRFIEWADAFVGLYEELQTILGLLINKDDSTPTGEIGSDGKPAEAKRALAEWASASAAAAKPPLKEELFLPPQLRLDRAFIAIKTNEVRYPTSQARRLLHTLRELRRSGLSLSGELPPITFQVAEQLHDLVRRSHAAFADAPQKRKEDEDELERSKGRKTTRRDKQGNPPTEKEERFQRAVEVRLSPVLNALVGSEPIRKVLKRLLLQNVSKLDALQKLRGKQSELRTRFVENTNSRYYGFTFSQLAKVLLVDECAFATQTVQRALSSGPLVGREPPEGDDAKRLTTSDLPYEQNSITTDNLRRGILGIRDDEKHYGVLGYFKTEAFKALADQTFPEGWSAIATMIGKHVDQNRNRAYGRDMEVERKFVAPPHRFVFEMLVSLREHPLGSKGGTDAKAPALPYEDVEKGDFESRLSITDEELDPLDKLILRLGVRQFLTTNYDFEIERFFQDCGYRRFAGADAAGVIERSRLPRVPAPDDYRVDGLGGKFRDGSFSPERAVDLITFAVDQEKTDASVYHLHGDASEQSRIVMTERDYMDLYLRNDRHRPIVNDGIRIAFGSTPILFVGLGMDESDVLRPLRQFMSDKDRTTNRTAIALFPAIRDASRRVKDAAALYLRYGVHTVYYGDGYVAIDDPADGKDAARTKEDNETASVTKYAPLDWLHAVSKLIDELIAINKEMLQPLQQVLIAAAKPENGGAEVWTSENEAKGQARSAADSLIKNWNWKEIRRNPFHCMRADAQPELHKARIERLRDALGKFEFTDETVPARKPAGKPAPKEAYRLFLLFGSKMELDASDKAQFNLAWCQIRTLPQRPVSVAAGEHGLPRQPPPRDPYLQFEFDLLGHLFRMTVWNRPLELGEGLDALREDLKISVGEESGKLEKAWERYGPAVRDLRARIVGLEGLKNSILTGTLCATLDRTEIEWRRWWEHWQISPPHRAARFQVERIPEPKEGKDGANPPEKASTEADGGKAGKVLLPVRYVRHMIENVITRFEDEGESPERRWLEDSPPNDPEECTGVRAFDTFLLAHQARTDLDAKTMRKGGRSALSLGRRMHLVVGERGVGKGSFMSAFMTPKGLGQYIASSWPLENRVRYSGEAFDVGPPEYLSAVFINLSFSTEIASTYDMTTDALLKCVAALADIEAQLQKGADPASLKEILRASMTALQDLPSDEDRSQASGRPDGIPGRMREIDELIGALSRLEKLKQLFGAFTAKSRNILNASRKSLDRIQIRFFLFIGATNLLNYPGGVPKNREIQQFMDFLTSSQTKDCPFDLVLTAGEQNLGPQFVRKTPFLKRYRAALIQLQEEGPQQEAVPKVKKLANKPGLVFVTTLRKGVEHDGIQNIKRREEKIGIKFISPTKQRSDLERGSEPIRLPKNKATNQLCTVHFARAMRTERLLVENFLPLAVILFIKHMLDLLRKLSTSGEAIIVETEWDRRAYAEVLGELPSSNAFFNTVTLRDDWAKGWKRGDDLDAAEKSLDDRGSALYRKTLLNEAYRLITDFADDIGNKVDRIDIRIENQNIKSKEKEEIKEQFSALRALAGENPKDPRARKNIKNLLIERYAPRRDASAFREWEEIRSILRSNRFCFTILLAAAERVALSGRNCMDGGTRAEAFIRKTVDLVSAVGTYQREDVVVNAVLDLYETFNKIGTPRYDVNLHQLIVRHLAVIGAPTSADVLVRVPEIRTYFDEIMFENTKRRTLCLAEALAELTERGLVFQIRPQPQLKAVFDAIKGKPEKKDGKAEGSQDQTDAAPEGRVEEARQQLMEYFAGRNPAREHRYTLHRLLQRDVIQKMGAGPREFVEINSFAPSLYASMPTDLPSLTPDAYRFLRRLVVSLSQYPDSPSGEQGIQSWHFGDAPTATRVQALRAALSVTRSTFSVSVVSRFEDYKLLEPDLGIPQRGYFETYRIQTRWLIRKAWHLLDEDQDAIDIRQFRPDLHGDRLHALYRDEIVWLYNECGVVCLVQGNLDGAVAHLRQAIQINRGIEGQLDGGMQHNRIALNLAVAQIERGRLDPARRRLNSILESEESASRLKGRIWHIAHGYIGLIHQISGNPQAAARHYRRAITMLRAYDDSRACSIFCRHLGDLERAAQNFAESRRHVDSAIDFAENGGHEDMHQKALLSRVRLDISQHKAAGRPSSIRDFIARIDRAEEYANTMEMPSLMCEALYVRAMLLMDQGETTLAGNLLAQSIALAKRNGMRLRLNASLTAYAKMLGMRDLKDQARQLLFNCSDMAKRQKNQLELRRIDDVFVGLT